MFKDAGKMIRDARERQGIRLEKVSSDLHIRVTYLQAIENGRSEILPSPVQGRGFVRMFAHYLKLDPESVLAIWDSPLPNETPSGPVLARLPSGQGEAPSVPRAVRRGGCGSALTGATTTAPRRPRWPRSRAGTRAGG